MPEIRFSPATCFWLHETYGLTVELQRIIFREPVWLTRHQYERLVAHGAEYVPV